VIYLDTSALVKLVRREPESDALADWLDVRVQSPWVCSALVEIELPRALRRVDTDLPPKVPGLVARLYIYEIDDVVRAAAGQYSDLSLRSLDAIHLATADAIFGPQLTAFVSYDRRQCEAADALGLPMQIPGG
jgi:predicted nucleic acid-binding protein